MFTVALVGGDGAGKTTIANRLVNDLPFRVKYLYMGFSTISSNAALPTSKLARFYKTRFHNGSGKKNTDGSKPVEPTSHDLHYSKEPRNVVWKAFRFVNRMLETYWRQMITFYYRLRGYMVIYDRHMLFDTAPKNPSKIKFNRFFDSIEYLILYYFLPKPDLVIFLDAPAEVLYKRKRESSLKHLRTRREATLKQAEKIENFVRIDASQPLETVMEEVISQINAYHDSVNSNRRWQIFAQHRK